MSELAAHVAELNAAGEQLARVGVPQVLHRPVSQIGASADPPPLARPEVVGVDPFENPSLIPLPESGLIHIFFNYTPGGFIGKFGSKTDLSVVIG